VYVFLLLTGCDQSSIAPQISGENKETISRLSGIVNDSKVKISSFLQNPGALNKTMNEEQQAIDQFLANPQAGFEAVLQEENGQNKLNLLASLYEQKDASDIRKNLANFLNETQLAEFDAQVALLDNSNTGSSLVNKTAGLGDDITYGTAASVVMLGASIAYNYIPWFKPLAKAAVIVGIAAGAATMAYFIDKINLAYEANALPGEGFAVYIRREASNWGIVGVGGMVANTAFAMNQGPVQRMIIGPIIGALIVRWPVTA